MGAKRLGMTSSGWVSITWYCSRKASSASFQLTGRRKACHHSARMASTFQASRMVAKGSMQLRSGGAFGSRLIQDAAAPDLAAHRDQVDGARLEVLPRRRSWALEMKVFLPSRP